MDQITNVGKRINCKKRCLWITTQLAVLLCLVKNNYAGSCGGYISVGESSKSFTSPNYPGQYDDVSNCIWLIEAPRDSWVNLTITFTGERYNGECSDYVEIRAGGKDGNFLNRLCDTHVDHVTVGQMKWLYVRLKSDQITGSGTYLSASVRAIAGNNDLTDITYSRSGCRSYEFECANHMCISMSYRCDDYNDCGCLENCDEDGCGSLPIGLATQLMISVGVGVCVFIIICLISVVVDHRGQWLSSKSDRK